MNDRIRIKNTSLSICPIGCGTVNAGLAWSQQTANQIFDAYLYNGGNVIDTARVYAGGRSETVIGNWFTESKKRSEVVLFTKGGHPKFDSPGDDLHIPRMTDADMRGDIETSLRELKTDYIDLYFYHRDNRNQTVEEEIETMENFRREGKIRYYGCSNWNADRIAEADCYCERMGYRGFVADQAMLNYGMDHMNPLADDTLVYIQNDLWDYHVKNDMNLAVPYMGAANGFFHKYALYGIESIKKSPFYTKGNVKRAEKCISLARKYNATITQIVLGFFMHQPFLCAPLYGPKDSGQIVEALRTLEYSFAAEDYRD